MNIEQLAQREAENLLRYCDPIELERLDFDMLDGNSINEFCFYGQITGNPDSQRAIEIICSSSDKVICNDIENDGKVVSSKQLKTFHDNYDSGLSITDSGRILDYRQRTLSYISPLEAYTPSEDHPERKHRIENIRNWLNM